MIKVRSRRESCDGTERFTSLFWLTSPFAFGCYSLTRIIGQMKKERCPLSWDWKWSSVLMSTPFSRSKSSEVEFEWKAVSSGSLNFPPTKDSLQERGFQSRYPFPLLARAWLSDLTPFLSEWTGLPRFGVILLNVRWIVYNWLSN